MPNKKANAERRVQDAMLCKGKHMQKISMTLCPFAGLSVLGIDTIVLFLLYFAPVNFSWVSVNHDATPPIWQSCLPHGWTLLKGTFLLAGPS